MIYVDNMYRKWGRGIWCHLWGPDEQELHDFAYSIGLKRAWFQDKNPTFRHYDVNKTRRALAVEEGAIEVTMREMVELRNKQIEYILMNNE